MSGSASSSSAERAERDARNCVRGGSRARPSPQMPDPTELSAPIRAAIRSVLSLARSRRGSRGRRAALTGRPAPNSHLPCERLRHIRTRFPRNVETRRSRSVPKSARRERPPRTPFIGACRDTRREPRLPRCGGQFAKPPLTLDCPNNSVSRAEYPDRESSFRALERRRRTHARRGMRAIGKYRGPAELPLVCAQPRSRRSPSFRGRL